MTLEVQGMPVISLSNYILLVNALTSEALRQDVGAVVLTGTPGKFLFGMDITEIGYLETPEATRGMTAHVQDLLNRLEAVTAPIICAVDGNCFGGGLELVLACHAVFATQDSTSHCRKSRSVPYPRSAAPKGWPELSVEIEPWV